MPSLSIILRYSHTVTNSRQTFSTTNAHLDQDTLSKTTSSVESILWRTGRCLTKPIKRMVFQWISHEIVRNIIRFLRSITKWLVRRDAEIWHTCMTFILRPLSAICIRGMEHASILSNCKTVVGLCFFSDLLCPLNSMWDYTQWYREKILDFGPEEWWGTKWLHNIPNILRYFWSVLGGGADLVNYMHVFTYDFNNTACHLIKYT